MPHFGAASTARWHQLHPKLRLLMSASIRHVDFTIVTGGRGRHEQEKARKEGLSNAGFGQSPHNYAPSLAVDVAPWDGQRVIWRERDVAHLGGIIAGIATQLGIEVVTGANWGRWAKSPSLYDPGHIELAGWAYIVAAENLRTRD